MKTFLIQTFDKQVTHDFSFHLIEAIKYNNWYQNEKVYEYQLVDQMIRFNDKDYIPVGSVEFVQEFLSDFHGISNVKPINIPSELMKWDYTKRWVGYNDDPTVKNVWHDTFIKDKTKIKGETKFLQKNEFFPEGEWLVSAFIDIQSEWRAFVFRNKLVGLQNYSGDFTLFPDINKLNLMINDYQSNPAYTLDVGINENGIFIIEVHDFFSCGLYGFADYVYLPRMFIATWNKLISSK